MAKVLEVNQVSKSYGEFSLEAVDFSLERGYIMGFVGPNGAGKTTTIQLILNAVQRDSGQIKVFGLDNRKNEKEIKAKLGVVFDQAYLVQTWTLKEVEKAFQLFYENWNSQTYDRYLKRFGLNPKAQVKDLSRGMMTKLMLATALCHEAELLLLDEPTSGLDPASRAEVMEVFQEYIEDGTKSILFSTHVTSDLEKIADYITCLNTGKMYYTGTKDELLEAYKVVKGAKEVLGQNRKYFIGCRTFSTGFEGLVKAQDVRQLVGELVVERASIEDIIVFYSRGGKKHVR